MKTWGLFLFALGFCSLACKKDICTHCPDGMQEAAIIGQDLRLCVCCGGWFIDLGQDTVRTFTLPDDFKFDTSDTFPIPVCLSYEAFDEGCNMFGNLIKVNQIIKR